MGKYFGTDGIRAEANSQLMNPSFVLRVGQALGVALREKNPQARVIIGKDTRISGYMLENALASGLCSVGAEVWFAGPLPTPGVAYLTRGMRVDAGVVISASHNPYSDNGIKIFDRHGFKLPDEVENYIENLIDASNFDTHLCKPAQIGRARRIDDAMGQYAVFLKEQFPRSLSLEGLRIVVDCAHGASYKVAPKVFSELGAEVFCIHNEPNGFNINLESGALHPEQLQAEVRKYRANIGIALDGDADRLVVVDEQGHIVDGDQIIAMCAIELKNQGKLAHNAVAVTVMSNKGLDIALERHGISVYRTQVGDRYVVEEMRKRQLVLGGEQSGHLLFLDSSTTGDGILAALKVLELMIRTGKPISELAAVMEPFPQLTRSVRVKAKPPLAQLPKVTEKIAQIEGILGKEGRILVRYSGTEPVARITLEGPDRMSLFAWASELEKILLDSIDEHMLASHAPTNL